MSIRREERLAKREALLRRRAVSEVPNPAYNPDVDSSTYDSSEDGLSFEEVNEQEVWADDQKRFEDPEKYLSWPTEISTPEEIAKMPKGAQRRAEQMKKNSDPVTVTDFDERRQAIVQALGLKASRASKIAAKLYESKLLCAEHLGLASNALATMDAEALKQLVVALNANDVLMGTDPEYKKIQNEGAAKQKAMDEISKTHSQEVAPATPVVAEKESKSTETTAAVAPETKPAVAEAEAKSSADSKSSCGTVEAPVAAPVVAAPAPVVPAAPAPVAQVAEAAKKDKESESSSSKEAAVQKKADEAAAPEVPVAEEAAPEGALSESDFEEVVDQVVDQAVPAVVEEAADQIKEDVVDQLSEDFLKVVGEPEGDAVDFETDDSLVDMDSEKESTAAAEFDAVLSSLSIFDSARKETPKQGVKAFVKDGAGKKAVASRQAAPDNFWGNLQVGRHDLMPKYK